MTKLHGRDAFQRAVATLLAVVVIIFFAFASLQAAPRGPSERRKLPPNQVRAVANPPLGLDSGHDRDVLALEENRRGTLRERIRTRREERISERLRDKETPPEDPDTWSPGRRINPGRVQSWIAQLREKIREEVSDLTGNRLPQTYPGPSATPLLPDPRATGPFPQPVIPAPLPGASPAAPGIVTDPGRAQSSIPQDLTMPGPELVPPQLSHPGDANAKAGDLNPSGDVPQAAETHGPSAASDQMNLPSKEDSTDAEPGLQTQQPSKPTGLGGLFSNVTKMFGAAGSNDQQTSKPTGEQSNATNSSSTQRGGDPAQSASGSQSPTAVRKTLSEIRKQILMKQNQKAAGG
ncbi:MAG: hypothetical protein ACUVQR_09580 [Thermogutta sp.]